MTINQCRGTKETFEKFKSNGIGDPYIDAGQYIMRKPDARSSSTINKPAKAWTQSGSNKKVKKSEFVYKEQGPPERPRPETLPRFKTHVKSEPFTNQNNIGYKEDPYEHKQDDERREYARLNGLILHRDKPWTNTVKQHGEFYPHAQTYGTAVNFPEKKKKPVEPFLAGPFKPGNPLKTGHNKCIGGRHGTTEEKYMEETIPDKVFG